jgi:Flp/Fap pilin component
MDLFFTGAKAKKAKRAQKRPTRENGATAVEYALMVGLIAVGIIASGQDQQDL